MGIEGDGASSGNGGIQESPSDALFQAKRYYARYFRREESSCDGSPTAADTHCSVCWYLSIAVVSCALTRISITLVYSVKTGINRCRSPLTIFLKGWIIE